MSDEEKDSDEEPSLGDHDSAGDTPGSERSDEENDAEEPGIDESSEGTEPGTGANPLAHQILDLMQSSIWSTYSWPKIPRPKIPRPKIIWPNPAILNALEPIVNLPQLRVNPGTGAINSEIFKGLSGIQPELTRATNLLTSSLDFSFAASATRAAEQFARHTANWIDSIQPVLDALEAEAYPPNLQNIDEMTFEHIETVVMVDGIPLYGLPRPATAQALLFAEGAAQRREVLGRRAKTISADCRNVVDDLTSEATEPYITFARAALDALDTGHPKAAQALASSLIDATTGAYFGNNTRKKLTAREEGNPDTEAYEELTIRQYIAFAPMWQAYQRFFPTNGDPVPHTFSRHATAHTVSPRQYSTRNAIQAAMFACSLLCRIDEEAHALSPQS